MRGNQHPRIMKTPGTSVESKVLSLAATLILIAIVLLGGVWLRQSDNRDSGRQSSAPDRPSAPPAHAMENALSTARADSAEKPRRDGKNGEGRRARLENLDARGVEDRKPGAARSQALEALKRKIPGVAVQVDPITGAPDHIMAAGRFLAPAKVQPGDAYGAVRDFVNEYADLFGGVGHDG